jgi:hypothetical protein
VPAADWWSRSGAVIALLTGVSYLMGVIIVSEFTRQLGVAASDLGLGVREYAVVALVAFAAASIFVTVIVAIAAFDSPLTRGFKAIFEPGDSPQGSLMHRIWRFLYAYVTFYLFSIVVTAALLLAPFVLAWEWPKLWPPQWGYFVAVAVSVYVMALIARSTIQRSRRRIEQGLPNHGAGYSRNQLTAAGVRDLARRPATLVPIFFAGAALVTIAGASAASRYSKLLLAGDRPVPPIVLRYVVNPSTACVFKDRNHSLPSKATGHKVVRIGRSASGEVLIFDGAAWLVEPAGLTFSSDCVQTDP